MNIIYDDVVILKKFKAPCHHLLQVRFLGRVQLLFDVLNLIKNLTSLYLLAWTLFSYFSYIYERYKFIDIYIAGLCPRNFSHKWLGYWIR